MRDLDPEDDPVECGLDWLSLVLLVGIPTVLFLVVLFLDWICQNVRIV